MNAEPLRPVQLRKIYRDTIEDVYGYVSRQTGGDRQLAEDVTQEAYLRALRSWTRHGVAEKPAAWLKVVARNLLVSHHRRQRPEAIADLDTFATSAEAGSPEDAAQLHWALGRLRREQARLLEAFHIEGKRVKEIASERGLSERAVEGRLRRARLALQDQLGSARGKGEPSS